MLKFSIKKPNPTTYLSLEEGDNRIYLVARNEIGQTENILCIEENGTITKFPLQASCLGFILDLKGSVKIN